MPTAFQMPSLSETRIPRRDAPGFRLRYEPALDGFRGVSILVVVAVHLLDLNKEFRFSGSFSFVGVDLFFVLSGFLITSLLLQEWHRTRTVSLKAFYTRRALRLLPALMLMLLACLFCALLLGNPRDLRVYLSEMAATLLYYMNWKMAFGTENVVLLRHSWSLSIEEQFYLIWPVLLLLLLRRGTEKTLENALALTLLGAFLSWTIRALLYLGTAVELDRLYCGLDTRADSLLLGCAAGMWLKKSMPLTGAGIRRLRVAAPLCLGGIVALGALFPMRSSFMYLLGWFLVSVFAAVIIVALVADRGTILHRCFENSWLVYVGKISYGLYLWHWPILRITDRFHWPIWQSAVINLALALLVAAASFRWFETPFLRVRRRFQRAE